MGRIQHIFIAPAKGAPMIELAAVEALTDGGLRGDRYAEPGLRKSVDYQLTLIEIEHIAAFSTTLGLALEPQDPRRNLVTQGVRLNDLCGKRFRVGATELEGLDLCEPCSTFAQRTHPETLRFFVHKGGLRCRIRRGGMIRVGDDVGDGA